MYMLICMDSPEGSQECLFFVIFKDNKAVFCLGEKQSTGIRNVVPGMIEYAILFGSSLGQEKSNVVS